MTQPKWTLAVYSETGGATKTATSVSLAVAAAEAGEDVVLADCDPRGAATKWTGARPKEKGHHIGAILGNDDPDGYAEELAVNLDATAGWPKNLRVIPSSRTLANHEKAADDHADVRLMRSLDGIRADRVVFDMPNRQGGLITQNCLTAAKKVLFAAKPNEDGLDGVDGAKESVQKFKEHRERLGVPDTLHVGGIVLGAAYKGAVWTRDALRAVDEFDRTSPGMLIRPFVPDLVIVSESRAAQEWYGKYKSGKPVFDAYRHIYRSTLK
ncbi:AAA family ATPase [Streptomyces sp. NPDC051162]|uniref:ParA family protein n=1 Tax=Streptomyces sp. NPDC051162 TaxID=3154747 RepID=UPI003440AA83